MKTKTKKNTVVKKTTSKKVAGMKSEQKDYTVEIKHTPEAIEKRLIKFTSNKKGGFEISAEKLIELLSHYVNSEELAPTFVDTQRINVVYVKRNIQAVLDRDFKAGEKVNFEYEHPYPLEFALIEEAFNIAKIDKDREGFVVTPELIKKTKKQTPKSCITFVKKFYESFKNLLLGNSS
jgi:hypothetical protein